MIYLRKNISFHSEPSTAVILLRVPDNYFHVFRGHNVFTNLPPLFYFLYLVRQKSGVAEREKSKSVSILFGNISRFI